MAVTQKDIAREVGVSQTIVSDVLQDRPRGRVSDETRRRILDTARRLSYEPNASACALRSRRSRQIAYVTTRREAAAFEALGEGIIGSLAGELAEHEHRLVIEIARSRADEVRSLREMLAGGVCDGCVVRVFEEADELWPELHQLSAPVVVVGQCPDAGLTSVAHDAEDMLHRAVSHLRLHGHQRLGAVLRPARGRYDRLLRDAWRGASKEELEPGARRTVFADERETGAAAAAGWLDGEGPPTAIVATSAPAALGVVEAAAARGLRPGHGFDLVVVGRASQAWSFPAGTWLIGTDSDGVGRRAAMETLRLLRGEGEQAPIRLRPQLIRL